MDFQQIALEAVQEHGAMQKVSELATLLEWLWNRHPVNVLEIGGMHGGTMWAWNQVATGRLICVDLQVLEGRMEEAPPQCELIVGDSTSSDTRAAVRASMAGQRFDFVFIDGDHRYEAVKADAANWLPLVAPGGAIAFHDICHRYIGGSDRHDMWRFWHEFSANQAHFLIYDPSLGWGGIGVVLVPPVPALYVIPPPPNAWEDFPTPPQCEYPRCTRCETVLNPAEVEVCTACAA